MTGKTNHFTTSLRNGHRFELNLATSFPNLSIVHYCKHRQMGVAIIYFHGFGVIIRRVHYLIFRAAGLYCGFVRINKLEWIPSSMWGEKSYSAPQPPPLVRVRYCWFLPLSGDGLFTNKSPSNLHATTSSVWKKLQDFICTSMKVMAHSEG